MGVSLRWVMLGFITLVAAVCTIVAFVPTYQVGMSSVQTAVDDVRTGIMNQLLSSLSGFFAAPQRAVSVVKIMQETGQTAFEGEPTMRLLGLACDMMTLDPSGTFKTSFFLMPDNSGADVGATNGRYIHCDARIGPIRGGYMNASGFFMFDMAFHPERRDRWTFASPRPYLVLRFNRQTFVSKNVWRQALTQPQIRWSGAYAGYDSLQMSAIFVFKDPALNTTCMFSLDVLPVALSGFLRNVGLRTRGRAMIAHYADRIVMGNSWGEDNHVYTGPWYDLTLPDERRMRGKRISEVNDSLMLSVVSHLGGESAVYAAPPKSASVMGKGKGKTYIDVDRFTDAYGLDLLVIVAMPEIDFLESVYSTRTTVIVIVCVAAAVMIGIAVAFAAAVTHPMLRLGDRMYATASLQDDGDDERKNLSFLAEIADIQTAYEMMKQELNRIKGFLPDSVLHGNTGEDSDEDDEGRITDDDRSRRTGEKGSAAGGGGLKNTNANNMRSVELGSVSSRMTSHSRSSHRSAHLAAAAAAAAGGGGQAVARGVLNTRGTLSVKRIAIVVLNLCNFHGKIKGMAPATIGSLQATMLKTVLRIARENRGVIDAFQGDHVVVTFNAVSAAQAYCRRAAQTAFDICTELGSLPELPFVRAGVAVGQACVGNSGVPELQRFNVIGEVYSEAWRCQAICAAKHKKPYGTRGAPVVLVTAAVHIDIETEFYCQHVDIANLGGGYAKQLLSTIEAKPHAAGATTAADEKDSEWMYRLSSASAMDPFRATNAIFIELLKSDPPSGAEILRMIAQADAEMQQRAEADLDKGTAKPCGASCEVAIASLRAILNAVNNDTQLIADYDAWATI